MKMVYKYLNKYYLYVAFTRDIYIYIYIHTSLLLKTPSVPSLPPAHHEEVEVGF
jgi:hypothetical protein